MAIINATIVGGGERLAIGDITSKDMGDNHSYALCNGDILTPSEDNLDIVDILPFGRSSQVSITTPEVMYISNAVKVNNLYFLFSQSGVLYKTSDFITFTHCVDFGASFRAIGAVGNIIYFFKGKYISLYNTDTNTYTTITTSAYEISTTYGPPIIFNGILYATILTTQYGNIQFAYSTDFQNFTLINGTGSGSVRNFVVDNVNNKLYLHTSTARYEVNGTSVVLDATTTEHLEWVEVLGGETMYFFNQFTETNKTNTLYTRNNLYSGSNITLAQYSYSYEYRPCYVKLDNDVIIAGYNTADDVLFCNNLKQIKKLRTIVPNVSSVCSGIALKKNVVIHQETSYGQTYTYKIVFNVTLPEFVDKRYIKIK